MDVVIFPDEVDELDRITHFVKSLSKNEKKQIFTLLQGMKYGIHFHKK